MSVKKVLITGVSGLVGSAIYQHLAQWPDRYNIYGLGRRRAISDRVFDKRKINIPDDKYMVGDIADMDFVASAVSGMDVVVHMAAATAIVACLICHSLPFGIHLAWMPLHASGSTRTL